MIDAPAATSCSSQSTDSINATATSTGTDGPYFRTIRQQLIAPDGEAPPEERSAKGGASLSTVMFNLPA
eukprot:CAMPEP_0119093130 /NCGR_PEP_ID=MMETSP1178-20130426/162120_1 /TAXON_ID=33656 /ORGANISM="unid sp, Strain CCMP2000" /LENGTH=68 /DNA_ID=CAMNT_0007076769 /DNA_START=38 /DNA_END=241 /DNA_ORIENTATION=+